MRRTTFAIVSAFLTLAAIAPAQAASFRATTAAAAPKSFVTRDVLWSCGAGTCTGQSDYARPVVVCQSLAKKVGPIAGFTSNGRALAAADLASCNAFAKKVAGDADQVAQAR